MKSKKNRVLILLISILIMAYTLNTDIINNFQSSNRDFVINQEDTFGIETLKKAGFWDKNDVSYIHISADNWSAQDLPWIQNRTGTWEDPHVIENVTLDGTGLGFGIKIENSNDYFIVRNITITNIGSVEGDAGLILNSVNNSRIYGNDFSSNYIGIHLLGSSFNNISGNDIFSSQNHGMRIEDNSDYNNIIGNNIFFNLYQGIRIDDNSDYNSIEGNEIRLNARNGIFIYTGCMYNKVSENIVSDNSRYGILVEKNSDFNEVFGNTVSNNTYHGIYIFDDSDNNLIYRNEVYENLQYGISVQRKSDNNSLIENNVYLNTGAGINIIGETSIRTSYSNTVYNNNVFDNTDHGIELSNYVDSTNISRNVIKNNDFSGIALIDNVTNSYIRGNLLKDNKEYGVMVGTNTSFNLIYQNSFIGNTFSHGLDKGVKNDWNNTIMGNYWDNHTSPDSDNDGIVDVPYTWITGNANSEDNLPLTEGSIHYGENIHIDDSGVSALNWSITAKLKEWCSGSGTYSDPYIIDGLEIDGSGSENGILIGNSSVYFIIQNSTVYNAGSGISGAMDAGIKLENTKNGNLANNNISNNKNQGILLFPNSYNNTISGNTVNNNVYGGVRVRDYCDNNTISGNTLTNNGWDGIFLQNYCDNNTISGNTANGNLNWGIYLFDECDNNIVSGNTVINNDLDGIYLRDECDNNTILGNTVTNNGDDGIYLNDECDNNIVSGNTVTNNGDDGIHVYRYCDDNTISGNTVTNNGDDGIHLQFYCDNNTISGNTANGNLNWGIYFYYYCDNNTILGNTVTNNGFDGIYLNDECDNNNISGNTVDVNGINGIYLNNDCNDNIISGNTAINNSENGISLWSSNNTIVSGNIVNYNIQYGIYLTNSYTNILSGNTVNNNDCGISLQTGGDNNNFSNNFIYFSQYQSIEIKSTNCDDNLIQRNILVSKEGEFITNLGNNTIIKDNYYGVKEPSFVVEVIDLSFSTTVFVLTINVSSQAAFLQFSNLSTQMWWDGVNISSDIVEVGNGLYNVSLTPIFVEPDENPILLNITFSAAHHSDKFFETYISVEPDSEPEEVAKLLYIDILSQIFSIEKFNITFFVFNESKHGIGSGTIQMWWNGSDVSSHIQNLGNGFYFVSLEPLTVKPGEEPIILEIAISTSEYEDFSFETYISVDPDILIEDDIIPSEFPFFLIIIIITSIASGIGITGAILFLLRRRKGVSEVINTNEP